MRSECTRFVAMRFTICPVVSWCVDLYVIDFGIAAVLEVEFYGSIFYDRSCIGCRMYLCTGRVYECDLIRTTIFCGNLVLSQILFV